MRTRYVISDEGKCIASFTGSNEILELNTQGKKYTEKQPTSPSDWWNFETESWESIGEKPSEVHEFDYTAKKWSDPRSLDQVKEEKWNKIKLQRNQLEFGGFEFDGNIYDSDPVSQGRIMGAAGAGIDQVWTLADNTTVELSASQLQQLYAALQAHIASVHERGRIARQLLFDAKTKEEVEAIQL